MLPEVDIVMKTKLPEMNNYMGTGYTQLNTLSATIARYLNDMGLKWTGTIIGSVDDFTAQTIEKQIFEASKKNELAKGNIYPNEDL